MIYETAPSSATTAVVRRSQCEGANLSDHEHVHAVQLDAGDVVAHGVVGGVRRRALLGCAHAVLVVLDTVDHGQLRQETVAKSVEMRTILTPPSCERVM